MLKQFKLVYDPFGQSNMQRTLNFNPAQPGRNQIHPATQSVIGKQQWVTGFHCVCSIMRSISSVTNKQIYQNKELLKVLLPRSIYCALLQIQKKRSISSVCHAQSAKITCKTGRQTYREVQNRLKIFTITYNITFLLLKDLAIVT